MTFNGRSQKITLQRRNRGWEKRWIVRVYSAVISPHRPHVSHVQIHVFTNTKNSHNVRSRSSPASIVRNVLRLETICGVHKLKSPLLLDQRLLVTVRLCQWTAAWAAAPTTSRWAGSPPANEWINEGYGLRIMHALSGGPLDSRRQRPRNLCIP